MLAEYTQKVFEIALEGCESHYVWVLFVNKWWKERIFASYLKWYSISSVLKDSLFLKKTLFCTAYTLDF